MRRFPRAERPFYELRAAARPEGSVTATELWIYDVIGDDWFDPSLTAKELCRTIAAVATDEIVLHLASPGGSVSDGIAIYNALISHPAKVTSLIEGWTGSIATIVALAAEHVAMFDNTMFMIHKPWGVNVGDDASMHEYGDYLARVGALMARVYLGRSARSEAELWAALAAETYLDAAQARDWGFVDEVLSGQAAVALDPAVLAALGFDPDPHYRNREPRSAGRTLSGENEGRLRDAAALIDEVLATLEARAGAPASAASGDAPATMDRSQVASLRLTSRRH